MNEPILEVRNLTTVFHTTEGILPAVQDVSFQVVRGETLGLVGESGCGKTLTALSILRLIREPGRIESGSILFHGEDLLEKSEEDMRQIRGNRIAMVFQEPMTSLNPVFTIGTQMKETIHHHIEVTRKEALERSMEMLQRVGIPAPEVIFNAYPHELSGGMRQRALIAMSLICNPDVLIADEPTTALDVTVQIQILELINRLKDEFGMAVILITHDLGVVAESCDRLAVMYASRIVECGTTDDLFYQACHPYTVGLLQAIPAFHIPGERLRIIPGQVPRPTHFPLGCLFTSRCTYATEQCTFHQPDVEQLGDGHLVRCWNHARVTNEYSTNGVS